MRLCAVPFVAVHGWKEFGEDGVYAVEEEDRVEEDRGKDEVVEGADCRSCHFEVGGCGLLSRVEVFFGGEVC